jgi:tRNA(fMet)-specific endonuclease VapC
MSVVDTCFLIDLMRNDSGALTLAENEMDLRTTSISAAEFLFGAKRSRRQDLVTVSRMFLSYFPILPFDVESAQIYADIAEALQNGGSRISSFDELIAAIAIRHGETLISRDSHFSSIPGLLVGSY